MRNWSSPGSPTPAWPKANSFGPVLRGGVGDLPVEPLARALELAELRPPAQRREVGDFGRLGPLRLVGRQDQHRGRVQRLGHQIREDRERRPAGRPGFRALQTRAHPFRFDLGRVSAERGAGIHPGTHGGEAGVEVFHQRVVLGGALLEQEGGVERRVDVRAQLVEGHLQLGLGFRVPGLFQLAAPGYVAAVVEPLLDVERGLPALLGKVGNAHAGNAEGRTGDVALVGALAVDLELGQPVGRDDLEPQIGGRAQQRSLARARIARERGVLQPLDGEGVLG